MQIKKVIAGGMAALAAGATLALGVGAATLGDFVQVTGNTMTSPYIVIGTNAAAADTLAAADIGVALAGQATRPVSIAGAQGIMGVDAGSALIQGEAYKLYIGTTLSNGNVKPDLTRDDLPTVLAGGTVDQKTITDVDYDEFLSMGGQQVTWSKQTDDKEPSVNLQFMTTDGTAYTYKLVFGGGLDSEYIEGKDITILGKTYVFSSQDTDLTNTSLVLYAAGQTQTVPAGESTTITVNGNDYVITVVGVNTEGTAATIDINGEAFDVDTTDDNYVTKGDLNAYIKSIRAFKYPAESGAVQLFIGSEKLTLDSTTGDVTKGTTVVDGAVVSFPTVSANKIYEIQIVYTPDDDVYVKTGEAFADPVFSAFDIAFGGIYPGLTDSTKDLVQIEKSASTKVRLKFTNKAGDSCSTDVYNTTEWATGTKLIKVNNVAASDGREGINSWNQTGNISEGEYFLVSQNYNSFILQYVSTDSTNNLVKLKDVCSGTTFDASTTTQFFYLGGRRYDFRVNTATEVIRVNQTGGATGGAVQLYTPGKAAIVLKSGTPGEFLVNEAPFSVAGIQGATQVTLNVSSTLSSGEVDAITIANASSLPGSGLIASETNTDMSYAVTKAGTYIVKDSDQDTIDIYIPAIPTPVYVAVGADPTFTSGGGTSGGTVNEVVQIRNSISKLESEVSTASLDRDLVLIGGPCANGLVATLLGMSATKPACSTEFTALYPTEGVIKVVSNAFTSGKKALVVAGVDRTATRDLAVKVMQGTVDYSA